MELSWHESWNEPNVTSAASLSRVCFHLGEVSSPKRFGWVKMNLDTGAAVNTFPLNFGPDGDGRFHRTSSGECVFDYGAWQPQSYDEVDL